MATADANLWAPTHFSDDGLLLLVGHRPGAELADWIILHTDTTGAVADSVRIPETPADSIGRRTISCGEMCSYFLYPPYGARELVAYAPGGGYAKAVSSSYRVAWYDAGGSLLRIIERRDVVGPELTVEERTRTQERVNADAERFDLSATERFRVPDRKAPLSRLFFDEAGRLWVQFSLRQGDPRKADVYAPHGTLAFTAEWPANISLDLPARVGETAALGIATDSLGVQRIVRMPIR